MCILKTLRLTALGPFWAVNGHPLIESTDLFKDTMRAHEELGGFINKLRHSRTLAFIEKNYPSSYPKRTQAVVLE